MEERRLEKCSEREMICPISFYRWPFFSLVDHFSRETSMSKPTHKKSERETETQPSSFLASCWLQLHSVCQNMKILDVLLSNILSKIDLNVMVFWIILLHKENVFMD